LTRDEDKDWRYSIIIPGLNKPRFTPANARSLARRNLFEYIISTFKPLCSLRSVSFVLMDSSLCIGFALFGRYSFRGHDLSSALIFRLGTIV
jgi:hypothetical protein